MNLILIIIRTIKGNPKKLLHLMRKKIMMLSYCQSPTLIKAWEIRNTLI